MRKLERRAVICLLLAAVLILGTGVFAYRFFRYGREWATYYGNGNVYDEGILKSGRVYDREDRLLAACGEGTIYYNDDWEIRCATVHAVGDPDGNIATGALASFRDSMIGYSPVFGTYRMRTGEGDCHLTLDAEACRTAYEYLAAYQAGCIGVYNYKTGEILCMVSTPAFDPADPPAAGEEGEDGLYLNRFLSATMVPGSTFKTVTSAAVIENLPDYEDFTYYCEGTRWVGDEDLNCMHVHGEVDFEGALISSCNGAYSVLTERLGAETMKIYAARTGMTASYSVDGIETVPGSFDFPTDSVLNLGWAGIGQYHDQVNPCAMMIYMGAIANGGKAALPHLLEKPRLLKKYTDQLLEARTAAKLTEMMRRDVTEGYGEGNFPGLALCAKTGTAEISGQDPTGWFCGFLDDPDHPLAFCCYVENAGEGIVTAAPIVNAVLQELVNQ